MNDDEEGHIQDQLVSIGATIERLIDEVLKEMEIEVNYTISAHLEDPPEPRLILKFGGNQE